MRENDDSAIRVETFDGVMVCTGPYRRPKIPQVPGMGQFAGKIMHMHQYRTRDTFARKNVLVVGKFQYSQIVFFNIVWWPDSVGGLDFEYACPACQLKGDNFFVCGRT